MPTSGRSYDLAEEAASNALALDPKLLKARFRRGVARKGLYRYMGAMAGKTVTIT